MKYTKPLILTIAVLFMATSFGMSQRPVAADESDIDYVHDLILDGKYKQLKMFLSGGDYANLEDEIGNSPLFFAVKVGDKKIIDLLIENEANVNKANETGTTPLMIAAKYGNTYAVKTLIKHGADPMALNNSGHTAETYASAFKHNHIKSLLKK